MGGWRSKLVLLLIVYFAGFATAIYCLAPGSETEAARSYEKSFVRSALKSDEFAQSFNVRMRKCVDFTKDAAVRAGAFLKQRLEDRSQIDG